MKDAAVFSATRNDKHVAMRGTSQAVHKKFGYSSLYVLNWQIRKSIQEICLNRDNWIIN